MVIKQSNAASVKLQDSEKEVLYETIELLEVLIHAMDNRGYNSIVYNQGEGEYIYTISEAEGVHKFLESIIDITQITQC